MFIELLEKIKEFDTIIIHRHERPDGDCIGSQMGLKYFIEDNFTNKKVYAAGDLAPPYLQKLGTAEEVSDELYQDALVIIVDTSTEKRICSDKWKMGKFIAKIDHHDDSFAFANIEYVDPLSPSCASIITSMIRSWIELDSNLQFTKKAAYPLYFGITTDTGRFRFRGVNKQVFDNAGYLVDTGIDIQELYNELYIDEIATLKLQGYVLNHFKSTENKVVYIHFTDKMMNKFGVTREDAGNLVNTLSSIRGALIWVAFIDQEGSKNGKKEIRVRLRSRYVSVNDTAALYRGGGHLQAAGATVYGLKEKNALLQDLDKKLKAFKEENPNVF